MTPEAQPARHHADIKSAAVVNAEAKPSAKMILTVNNADNELIVYVNETQAYDKKTNQDPTFNDTQDLTTLLKHGLNSVVALGINFGGQAHFVGGITLDGKPLLTFNDELPDPGQGVVASWVAVVNRQ